jgi:ribonucleoside-triphosphate reductase
MSERISSPEVCKRLVRTALSRFRLPYITITPTFSICPTHGYLAGEHEFCPRCDAERLAAKRAPQAA